MWRQIFWFRLRYSLYGAKLSNLNLDCLFWRQIHWFSFKLSNIGTKFIYLNVLIEIIHVAIKQILSSKNSLRVFVNYVTDRHKTPLPLVELRVTQFTNDPLTKSNNSLTQFISYPSLTIKKNPPKILFTNLRYKNCCKQLNNIIKITITCAYCSFVSLFNFFFYRKKV